MSDFGGLGFGPRPEDEQPGGGFDWMSSLAPILGAAAAFRNPAAGAAIFGIGDYLRRQKMSEIAAQRDQRQQALQQQRDQAVQEHFGGRFPLGTTFQQASDATAEQRRQEIADRAAAKQEASQKAISGAVGLESGMMQGLPSEAAAKLAQITSAVEPASRGAVQPTQQRINAAQEREYAASELPAVLAPEAREALVRGAAWDPKASLPQMLERRGYDPKLAGAEGEGYIAGRAKLKTEGMKAEHEQEDMRLMHLYSTQGPGALTPAQRQRIKVLATTPYELSARSYAGKEVGVDPGEFSAMSPMEAAKAARMTGEAFARREGATDRTKYEAVTPAHLARQAGEIPIAARRTAAVGEAETGVLDRRLKKLEATKLDIEGSNKGPFLMPTGEIVPSIIASPRQMAGDRAPIPMTPKDQAQLTGFNKVRTVVNTLDELTKQMNTAKDPVQASKQGWMLRAQANPSVLGVPALSFMQQTIPTTYASTQAGFAGVLSKSLGEEVGVLTEQDVQRVVALTPDFNDTRQTRDLKIGLINVIIDQSRVNLQRKLQGLRPEDEEAQKGKIRALIEQSIQQAQVADPAPDPSQVQGQGGPATPPPAVGDRIQQGMTMRRRFNPATGLLEEVR